MDKNPSKREIGTDSLVCIYKNDTPGQCVKNIKKLSQEKNIAKINEIKVNDIVFASYANNIGIQGKVTQISDNYIWIEPNTGLSSTINVRNFKFLKENVKRIVNPVDIKQKKKDRIILNPNKKDTEFNIVTVDDERNSQIKNSKK